MQLHTQPLGDLISNSFLRQESEQNYKVELKCFDELGQETKTPKSFSI